MSNFNSIGLIAKIGNAKIIESLQRLERYLAAQDVKVTLETTTAQFLPDCALPNTSQEEMGSRCDLVIVVGGDGVILGAAREHGHQRDCIQAGVHDGTTGGQ